MAAGGLEWGTVACPCGAVLRLPFAASAPNPAYYKTWCAACGTVLEGSVTHAPGDPPAPPPRPGKTER